MERNDWLTEKYRLTLLSLDDQNYIEMLFLRASKFSSLPTISGSPLL